MKRILIAPALAAALLFASGAHAAGRNYDEQDAHNHGYATAALEKVCPGMTVTDPKLRAKLDKKYRNTADFKDGYDWVAKRIDDASKGAGRDYNLVTWMTCANPAVSEAKWLHQDSEILAGLEARMQRDAAQKNEESKTDKLKAAIEYYNQHPFAPRGR